MLGLDAASRRQRAIVGRVASIDRLPIFQHVVHSFTMSVDKVLILCCVSHVQKFKEINRIHVKHSKLVSSTYINKQKQSNAPYHHRVWTVLISTIN